MSGTRGTGNGRPGNDEPRDDLLAQYRQASASDTRRPAPGIRDAVLAEARAALALRAAPGERPFAAPQAANDARWKWSMLAGIALAGITGLLVLQIDRGSDEDKEIALGAPHMRSEETAVAPLPKPAPPAASANEVPAQAPLPATPAVTAAAPDTAIARTAPARQIDPRAAEAAKARAPADVPDIPASPRRNGPTAADDSAPQAFPAAPAALPAPAAPVAAPAPVHRNAMVPPPPAAPLAPLAPLAPVAPVAAPSPAALPPPAYNAEPDAATDAAVAAAPAASTEAEAAAVRPSGLPRAAAPAEQRRADEAPSFTRGRPSTTSTLPLASALQEAARQGHASRLDRLLVRGAPLNAADTAGRTPLMLAVIFNHPAMVQRLLAAGANVSLVDRDGMTALMHARRLKRERIASLIEQSS